MKYVHLAIGLLFFAFAIVQWNDPDSLVWIILYSAIGVVAILAFRGKYYRRIYLGSLILLLLAVSFYVPDIAVWVKDGMPSITDSMKASSPYIELVREFFGLFICLIAMTFYLVLSNRR